MQQKNSKETIKKDQSKNKTKQKNKSQNKLNSKKEPFINNEQAKLQKIKQYFSKISQLKIDQNQNYDKTYQINQLHQSITNNIIKGNLKVSETSKKIQQLLKPAQMQIRISQNDLQIYQKQAKRIQHLKLITVINKQLKNQNTDQQIPYILSKEEHQRKVSQIIEQKKQRDKKIEQLKKIMKQKEQIKLKQEAEKEKIEKQKAKEKKKLQISQKIMKQKEQHIHFLSQQIKHKKDLQKIVTRVPLHVKMQQKFISQFQIPQIQQKKKLYQQVKQFKQKYSLDTIKRHQSQYLNRKGQLLQQSKISSRVQSNFKIKFSEKSQKLQSILAQQIRKNKMIWTQRDRYIQEKIKRQQNYLKKLKEQHLPKIDEDKKNQIQQRLRKEKQHLSKIGLNRDPKKIGSQYLNEVKNIVKKKKQYNTQYLDQYHSEILAPVKRSFSERSVILQKKNNQFIQKIRQKRLAKLLNSQDDPESKLQKLSLQTKKLQSLKQRKFGFLKHNFSQDTSKQASNLALNSIKAKIGMIQLIKKQETTSKQ